MILIPCNAGHQDYIYDNVAHAFSKKKGSVTASDGTVVLNDYPSRVNNNSIFSSEADSVWRYYVTGVRKKNVGWVKYINSKAMRYSYRTHMTVSTLLKY